MKKNLARIWPSITCTIIIFILLAIPTGGVNEIGMLDIIGADKIIHLFLFMAFTFFWGHYFTLTNPLNQKLILALLILVGSAYGLGMEYYQKFFTQRNFSLLDALADAIGTIIGAIVVKKSPYGNRGRNQN